MAGHSTGGSVPGAALVRAAMGRMAAEGEAAWLDWILCELVAHCGRLAGDPTAWEVLLGGLRLGALEDASVRTHLQVLPLYPDTELYPNTCEHRSQTVGQYLGPRCRGASTWGLCRTLPCGPTAGAAFTPQILQVFSKP